MTTPAVNLDQVTNNLRYIWSSTTGSFNPDSFYPQKWERRQRPQSSVSPWNDGFRPCKPWTHFGVKASYSGGENYLEIFTEDDGWQRRLGTRDGALWNYVPGPALNFVGHNLRNAALSKALGKLKDQKIHVGVAIAEGRRTANMVHNAATQIARQVRAFRRAHPKQWLEVLKYQTGFCPRRDWHKIPSRWLELQYGWRPLLADIVGAMEQSQRAVKTAGSTFAVRAMVREEGSATRDGGNTVFGPWTYTLNQEYIAKCYIALWFKLNTPELAELSQIGLINPLEIVWEMVPFSFVVDWFLPIGPWLSALSADVGYSFQGGSCSMITHMQETFGEFDGDSSSIRLSGGKPDIRNESFYFERTCYDNSPVPGFYVKNPFSITRMLNALALLALAFKPKRR